MFAGFYPVETMVLIRTARCGRTLPPRCVASGNRRRRALSWPRCWQSRRARVASKRRETVAEPGGSHGTTRGEPWDFLGNTLVDLTTLPDLTHHFCSLPPWEKPSSWTHWVCSSAGRGATRSRGAGQHRVAHGGFGAGQGVPWAEEMRRTTEVALGWLGRGEGFAFLKLLGLQQGLRFAFSV